jgi:hypothetical protein
MKTAVEWFAKELYEKFEMKGDGKVFDDLLEQAKEMEKEQRETYKYTEEDMINFNEWVTIGFPNQRKFLTKQDKGGFLTTKQLLKKWLDQFKQQQ